MTYLERFRHGQPTKRESEDPTNEPIFSTGERVTVTFYPVDSTMVGQQGWVRSVRGRYGARASEASTGAMLASPGEYLYEIALDSPAAHKPKTISVRESGLELG